MPECDNCAACCIHFPVEVSREDERREPRLSLHVIPSSFGRVVNPWPMRDGCPMLAEHGSCSIYPTRPDVCRKFEPGSISCNHARVKSGLEAL